MVFLVSSLLLTESFQHNRSFTCVQILYLKDLNKILVCKIFFSPRSHFECFWIFICAWKFMKYDRFFFPSLHSSNQSSTIWEKEKRGRVLCFGIRAFHDYLLFSVHFCECVFVSVKLCYYYFSVVIILSSLFELGMATLFRSIQGRVQGGYAFFFLFITHTQISIICSIWIRISHQLCISKAASSIIINACFEWPVFRMRMVQFSFWSHFTN